MSKEVGRTAYDGEDAISAAAIFRPDVILRVTAKAKSDFGLTALLAGSDGFVAWAAAAMQH